MARTVSQAWSEGRDINNQNRFWGDTWEGAILEALRKNGNSGHLSYLLVKSDYVFVFILKIKACLNLLVA